MLHKNDKQPDPARAPDRGPAGSPGPDLPERHGGDAALENHLDNVRLVNELIREAKPGESVSVSMAAGRTIVLSGREADMVEGAQALIIKGPGETLLLQALSDAPGEIMIRRGGGQPEPVPVVEGGSVRMTPIGAGDALVVGGAEFKIGRPAREIPVDTREELSRAVREQEQDRPVVLGRQPAFGPDEDGIRVNREMEGASKLSRNHARIEHTASGTLIADLGSTNGVRVNGELISAPTVIGPGDSVMIGMLEFRGNELIRGTEQTAEPATARHRTPQEMVTELLDRGPEGLRDFFAIAREFYDRCREEKTGLKERFEGLQVIQDAAVKWALSPHDPAQLEALARLEADPGTAGLAAALRQRQYPPTDSGGNTIGGGLLNLPEKFSNERFMKEERGDIVAVRAHAPSAEWEARTREANRREGAPIPYLDVGGSKEGQFLIADNPARPSASFGVTRTIEPDGEVRHTILQQAIQSCVRTSALMLALDAAANHGVRLENLDILVHGVQEGGTSNHEAAQASLAASLAGSGLEAGITRGGFDTPATLDRLLRERGPAMVSVGGDIGGHVVVVDKVNAVPKTPENPSGYTVTMREPYHGWRIDVPWENLKRSAGPHDLLQVYPGVPVSPAQAKIASLEEGQLVLGRHESVDIRLTAEGVSRRHAVLTPTAEGLLVRDLGSTNGTFVNGERIPEQGRILRSGDVLTLGKKHGNETNQIEIP